MYRFLPAFLLGLLTAAAVIVNTFLVGGFLLLVAVVKIVVPIPAWRAFWTHALTAIAEFWIHVNSAIIALTQPTVIELRGFDDPRLRRDGRFLVASNHQTWSDVPILQHVLIPHAPFLRFFIKQELIWLPVLGLAWWALDMPFMKRYSSATLARHPELKGEDIKTTRRACEKFRRGPISIMNFIEGTRFSPAKRDAQKSPYRHLLKPKAGGLAAVLDALSGDLDTLVNLTIVYGREGATFWDFLTGRLPRVLVEVTVEDIPPDLRGGDYLEDEAYRERFQEWVRLLWEAKDRRLEALIPEVIAGHSN
jgi:1-acyl-sn-glycerol-3-phosphate acyltransferase